MTNSKIVILGLSVVAMLFQSMSASADQMTLQQVIDLGNSVVTKVDARAEVLARESNIRSLQLRERSLERQLNETEMRVRTIDAMATQRGDIYSISKEFIYENANVLFFGCYLLRLVIDRNFDKNQELPDTDPSLSVRGSSVFCGIVDFATITIGGVALLANKTTRAVFEDAFMRAKPTTEISGNTVIKRTEALKYPKSSGVLRAGFWAMAGLMVVQQTLAWTYDDELDYRQSIQNLSPTGIAAEIQKQIKQANELNLELASVRAAKILIAKPSQK